MTVAIARLSVEILVILKSICQKQINNLKIPKMIIQFLLSVSFRTKRIQVRLNFKSKHYNDKSNRRPTNVWNFNSTGYDNKANL